MTYNSPSVQYIGMLHIYQMLDSFIYEEEEFQRQKLRELMR